MPGAHRSPAPTLPPVPPAPGRPVRPDHADGRRPSRGHHAVAHRSCFWQVARARRQAGGRHRPRPPAARPRAGPGRDEPDLPRRRDLVPRPVLRRPPQLPGGDPRAARRGVRQRRQLQPRHLRPERRRHLRGAPPHRLDRRADRLRRDRRRRLHQRRHPVQPPGPAAGSRPRAARPPRPGTLRILASTDSHFSVQKAARLLGLGDVAVVPVPVDGDRRMDVGALGTRSRDSRPTTSCRWPSSPPPAPPTSARSTR